MFSIFKTFFALGWISFGGPAAHIGYFRTTFVEKLKWLDDHEYAQLVALSQFLPGPGSSQVGFALGYKRGGLAGACLAFIGFTLPSVLLMLLLATLSSQFTDSSLFHHAVHGLKLLAVVVVADATLGMYRNFCQNRLTVTLCLFTAITLLLVPGLWAQITVLVGSAVIGVRYLAQRPDSTEFQETLSTNILPLFLFATLLIALPWLANLNPSLALFSHFYQAGSLVFGGGHVVLPLLQNLIGEQLSSDVFLTGYAAAQAVPGPMFTFATYLGFELLPDAPLLGALLATLAVFLPGFLLLLGVLKNWQLLARRPAISGAVNGVNASVVGLLLSALYTPVFTSAVSAPLDLAMVLLGVYLLKQWHLPIVWMVALFIFSGLILGSF
ncbi:chromate efflux transporter [Vibrio proteolyticus]